MYTTLVSYTILAVTVSSGTLNLDQGYRNTTEFAAEHGITAKEYKVVTKDGYILGIFNLPGTRGLPILLMHGLTDSSDTWLIRGNISLGITLANLGYDVWLGNLRGNKYSREHTRLDPERDAAVYWDFSFHENGYYDLPATIDLVLEKTGASQINAIGHSQGTTIFFVLASLRPEYNEKVNLLVAMAPVAFLQYVTPPLSTIIKVSPELINFGKRLKQYEIFGESITGKAYREVCLKPTIGYLLCAYGYIFPVAGYDVKEYGYKFHYMLTRQFPMSTSLKNLEHFAQVSRRRSFSAFDYGRIGNLKVYGTPSPLNYDLKKTTMPVAILCGESDKLATFKDVLLLKDALPNIVQFSVVDHNHMNHVDFTWGKTMDKYLYPYIFGILDRFGN
ncbi:unnamed protein product [Leptosia nina]|uniref:Lipase n=1 Tax=Leptosia nina TaxID=320188 RepID=A0AAV1JYF6_9NEOP